MGYGKTHPAYWVGVGVLCLAFGLSLAGLASPYWYEFDHVPNPSRLDPHAHQGLWKCRSDIGEDGCGRQQNNAGLWRVLQALEALSIVCLFCGWLGALVCLKGGYRRSVRGCHSCVAAAVVTGGVFGLAGDMCYVGHVEVYRRPLPADIPYSWSFALSVAGHIAAFLAAAFILASATWCQPKFASLEVKPYLEDYTLHKIGSAPLQYVYTLPTYAPTGYFLAETEHWPTKDEHYKAWSAKGDHHHHHPSEKWPALEDRRVKEKRLVKGDHHKKDEARVALEKTSATGKKAKTADKGAGPPRDQDYPKRQESDIGYVRAIDSTHPLRGHALQSERTSPLVDPLMIDAASQTYVRPPYQAQTRGPVHEVSAANGDKVSMDTSGAERLIWRPKATPPDQDRPMASQRVMARQSRVEDNHAYPLPWRRFLWMPPDPRNRPLPERVVIKTGNETFVL